MRWWTQLTCSVFLLFLSPFLVAQPSAGQFNLNRISYYPQEFYLTLERANKDYDLKQILFNILSSVHEKRADGNDLLRASCPASAACQRHQSLGYSQARRLLFGHLHIKQIAGGFAIRDVYCGRWIQSTDATTRPPAPNQIPDSRLLNAEHTWPQSRFSNQFDRDLQKSDLHILFPVWSPANSSRGNIEFGDVSALTSSPCPGARRGRTASGGSKTYFEVPPEHKGNVARAIFYFSTRYQLTVGLEEESSLRAWHRSDPVDSEEIDRNESIHQAQSDRNPFIDYPELVELISDF